MMCVLSLVKGDGVHHYPLNTRRSITSHDHTGVIVSPKGYPNPRPKKDSIDTSPPRERNGGLKPYKSYPNIYLYLSTPLVNKVFYLT